MNKILLTRRAILSAAALALSGAHRLVAAATLPAPAENPILSVAGNIAATNKEGVALFDRPMLENLGMVSFETTTPWFNGVVKFEGVPMTKLLAEVGAKGDRLVVVALNDYKSEIPIEDFERYGVIMALKRDGGYMPVRDKGPLFIVYPFDSKPELKSQKFYSRSVWQVKAIEVR
jgi:hypothetical protein